MQASAVFWGHDACRLVPFQDLPHIICLAFLFVRFVWTVVFWPLKDVSILPAFLSRSVVHAAEVGWDHSSGLLSGLYPLSMLLYSIAIDIEDFQ